jgi:hypothetical protein
MIPIAITGAAYDAKALSLRRCVRRATQQAFFFGSDAGQNSIRAVKAERPGTVAKSGRGRRLADAKIILKRGASIGDQPRCPPIG